MHACILLYSKNAPPKVVLSQFVAYYGMLRVSV